jgi:Acetoacetate decarboxylase (ADC)
MRMTSTPTTRQTYEIAGRTVTMPVMVRDASAGTAVFDVDAAAARALLPGEAFEVVETSPGRCQLAVATVDYRDNDLGDYHEVGLMLFVVPRDPAGDGADGGDGEAGTFITHLPVDQEFTCEAGRLIWGFPKTVEEISLDVAGDRATTSLRMDGELVLRLTLPRGGDAEMPPLEMVSYTYIDGVPHATAFSQGGTGAQVLPGGDGAELELGTHPVAETLRALGLPATPVLTTWTERMRGRFDPPTPLA